jgi:beta-N-acetylhexosaminidase
MYAIIYYKRFTIYAILACFYGIYIAGCTLGNSRWSPHLKSELIYDNYTTDIEDILENMSTREKIGQMVLVIARGQFQPDDTDQVMKLEGQIRQYGIGGVIFSSGDVYGQAILTNKLQASSKIPLWITQDMEFGAAMRISGTTRFTPSMGVAATGNTHFDYLKGKITALESKAIGVNQIYAPVLDVNNNPNNPVINTRSYSEDPQIVGLFADAFIRGAQEHGVMATGKHFPGHGDTNIDSHLALPTIAHGYEQLNSLELVPFRSAIRSGIGSIMSAHIAFPKLGTDPTRPGTLDPNILSAILRDSLQFKGLIVTDALEMNGIQLHYAPDEVAILAINAGADMLLTPVDVITTIDSAEKAVLDGRIPIEKIDNAVRRILKAKLEYGLFESKPIDVENLSAVINTKEYRMISDEIARSSITILKNKNDIVPIQIARYPKITLITIADDRSGITGSSFASAIRKYHPNVTFHNYDLRSSEADINRMIASARDADLIILGSYIYVQTSNRIEFTNVQKQLINRITSSRKPVVLASFGNPYIVVEVESANVHLLAWAAFPQQVDAAAGALFGAANVNGTLPVTIPGLYKRGDGFQIQKSILRNDIPEVAGMNSEVLDSIDAIMNEAIRNEIFPGGVVSIIKDGIIAYEKAFGYHDYTKRTMTRVGDFFDLASISKVMGTTFGLMKLVDEGKVNLEDKVSTYFKEFNTLSKKDITIYQLMTHISGLPAFRVYVDKIKTRDELIDAILNEPLINEPGEVYIYSDLGPIITALIIEKVTNQSLDVYMNRNFYTPMGMSATTFNPTTRGRWYTERVLPTENDTIYRHKLIQGEVHDERAYYLDGVAGHAGLFSNVADLAKFSHLLMNGGTYGGKRYIKESTIKQFTERQEPHNLRGIGFDLKSLVGFSSAGSRATTNTYGHTGFTGTSFWIDPERNIAVIILTNRTYPYRGSASGIAGIRASIADVVFNSIDNIE